MDKTLILFLIILLASCSNKSENKEQEEPTKIYIVTNEDEVGKYGKGTYLNSNSTYKSKDGLRWHRDNFDAPKKNETLQDVLNRNQSSYSNEYEEGYSNGYNDAESGRSKRY